jgi:DNA-binding MarR family transcriptional regulator
MDVFEEAVALHIRLQAAAEQLHGDTELTRACRGVLRDLAAMGPRTVPQLARRRPLSRQTVQVQVNRLVAAGMVELLDNPDHARSRLASLTAAGKAAVDAMSAAESRMAGTLPVKRSPGQLSETARILCELRDALESESLTMSRGVNP